MKSRIAKQTVHLSVEPQGMYSYAGPTDARPQRQYEYALGLKLIALSKIGTQGLEIRLYLCQRCTQKNQHPIHPPSARHPEQGHWTPCHVRCEVVVTPFGMPNEGGHYVILSVWGQKNCILVFFMSHVVCN